MKMPTKTTFIKKLMIKDDTFNIQPSIKFRYNCHFTRTGEYTFTKTWYDDDGNIHRSNGPAIVAYDSVLSDIDMNNLTMYWYINGKPLKFVEWAERCSVDKGILVELKMMGITRPSWENSINMALKYQQPYIRS